MPRGYHRPAGRAVVPGRAPVRAAGEGLKGLKLWMSGFWSGLSQGVVRAWNCMGCRYERGLL